MGARYLCLIIITFNGVVSGITGNTDSALGWLTAVAGMGVEETMRQRIKVLQETIDITDKLIPKKGD